MFLISVCEIKDSLHFSSSDSPSNSGVFNLEQKEEFDKQNMSSEAARLQSFANWPHMDYKWATAIGYREKTGGNLLLLLHLYFFGILVYFDSFSLFLFVVYFCSFSLILLFLFS